MVWISPQTVEDGGGIGGRDRGHSRAIRAEALGVSGWQRQLPISVQGDLL